VDIGVARQTRAKLHLSEVFHGHRLETEAKLSAARNDPKTNQEVLV
jgi:hypothetical protein